MGPQERCPLLQDVCCWEALLPQQPPPHCTSPAMPFLTSILLSPAAPATYITVGPRSALFPPVPSQNPPLEASQQNHSLLGHAPHQPRSNAVQRPHDTVPPLLPHQPSCIAAVPFLPSKQSHNPPCCCLVSTLPFLLPLSAPSYSALPTSSSSLSLRETVILLIDPASPASSFPSSASADTHAASPSTVELEQGRVPEAEKFMVEEWESSSSLREKQMKTKFGAAPFESLCFQDPAQHCRRAESPTRFPWFHMHRTYATGHRVG